MACSTIFLIISQSVLFPIKQKSLPLLHSDTPSPYPRCTAPSPAPCLSGTALSPHGRGHSCYGLLIRSRCSLPSWSVSTMSWLFLKSLSQTSVQMPSKHKQVFFELKTKQYGFYRPQESLRYILLVLFHPSKQTPLLTKATLTDNLLGMEKITPASTVS